MRFNFSQTVLAAALALTAMGSQAANVPHPGLRFMMTGGVTAGGDKIDKVTYTDGATRNISAGGTVTVGGGVLWQPEDSNFSLQTTLNYHFSNASASNGNATFDRYPLEVIAFYNFAEQWRVGVGARHVFRPNYSFDVAGGFGVDYKDANGALIEVGYFFTPQALLSLRYVHETYEEKTNSPYYKPAKLDGSHVGVNGSFIF
ncbi:hypothetical protein [Chitinimonas sp.]|uniref:hypothetical protein n=1 Tax=Chitinimonas sp. TaxID=1934313 RepID=UPI002F929CF7